MKQGYLELSNSHILDRANSAVLTLDEAKAHLRVTFDDDNNLISGLIDAATDYIEAVIEQPVMQASMSLEFDVIGHEAFDRVYIPVRNAIGVTEISLDGIVQDPASYALKTRQNVPYVQFAAKGTYGQVSVLFTAGFAAHAEEAPEGIKQAAKLIIGHWYTSTSAIASGNNNQPFEIPLAVNSLLGRYKMEAIG